MPKRTIKQIRRYHASLEPHLSTVRAGGPARIRTAFQDLEKSGDIVSMASEDFVSMDNIDLDPMLSSENQPG